MSQKNSFEKVAELRNTTTEKVIAEISFAIACAQISNPEIWKDVQHRTLEEKIAFLANMTLSRAS